MCQYSRARSVGVIASLAFAQQDLRGREGEERGPKKILKCVTRSVVAMPVDYYFSAVWNAVVSHRDSKERSGEFYAHSALVIILHEESGQSSRKNVATIVPSVISAKRFYAGEEPSFSLMKYHGWRHFQARRIKDPIYNSHGAFTWVVMMLGFEVREIVKNMLVTRKLFIEGNNGALFDDKNRRKYEGTESRRYKTIEIL